MFLQLKWKLYARRYFSNQNFQLPNILLSLYLQLQLVAVLNSNALGSPSTCSRTETVSLCMQLARLAIIE